MGAAINRAVSSTDAVRGLLDMARAAGNAAAVADTMLWARLDTMRQRLSALFAAGQGQLLVENLRASYAQLSPRHQARVLLSPEFCDRGMAWEHAFRRASSAKDGVTELLLLDQLNPLLDIHDLVSRELALAQVASGFDSPYLQQAQQWEVYSPAGDILAAKDDRGDWAIRSLPIIGDCVAIDLESPAARFHESRSGVLSQRCLAFTADERTALVFKLEQALQMIDQAEPVYGQIVRTFVRRIIVRKSQEESETSVHHGSEHAVRHPGSLRLLNVHRQQVSIEACMESVMHESTHSFLGAWELANGFFAANDDSCRVVSPWSGNPIPGSSFIHAAFVYYVCHRMHRKRLGIADGLNDQVHAYLMERLAVCAAGFLVQQRLSTLFLGRAPLNPELGALLDEMQADIRSEYRVGAAHE